ncbi:hypothetical protein [Kibdelosporangium philippinense]|uniref:hypothetical protein n=1 Tax=Kibdelosporangium philippinense TaxID=211113 RepID=UPI0036208EED
MRIRRWACSITASTYMTGVGEDLPHGRCGDLDAENGEFAVDPAVAPVRVLLREEPAPHLTNKTTR